MTAAASCGLGKPGGKVKATLSLGVIEDDNSILCLTETSGDQRKYEGAAATGWNSLAILKLLKLATVMAITTRTAGSPHTAEGWMSDSRVRVVPGEADGSFR